MCGIAGMVSKNDDVRHEKVQIMTDTLRHRGPDDSNVMDLNNCTLGHTRLSIIDLAHGKQPMQSRDHAITISFNGEIYGFKSLRKKLEYKFVTTSDTEVLLAAYQQYGYHMLDQVNGMSVVSS